MNDHTTLDLLSPGYCAVVDEIDARGITRRRLLDLGLVPGTRIEVVRRSPLGDPTAYQIRGAIIALRQEDASKIKVRPFNSKRDQQ